MVSLCCDLCYQNVATHILVLSLFLKNLPLGGELLLYDLDSLYMSFHLNSLI